MGRLWFALPLTLAASISASEVIEVEGTVRVGGRPERNAVVWLEAPPTNAGINQERYVLDQRNLTFSPSLLVVPVGASVEFPNNDRVFHNVFSFRDGKRFDLGLYPVGTSKKVKFDRPGVSRVFCNIHPQMAAYVIAIESPYFGVSDEAGRFVLKGVSLGSYVLRAWRPGASPITNSIEIARGTQIDIRWP